ncbi:MULTISPECIES: hypothetical protein [unclassified Hahella]|uniref:hypothetical protein n=1 Tax=unclassified Hahella TaxID=2624107 RepID=UPI001C1F0DED|nr:MULTISPECIES: hypothetical protein [unclassified Hahella]MBU6954463.1 hypothetical protein [Hahella sp. HN01]MDG9667804.1 hypothetical protein [Hahella sp. CR1]
MTYFKQGMMLTSALLLSAAIQAQEFATIEGIQVVDEQYNAAVMAGEEIKCAGLWTLSCIWPEDCRYVKTSTGFVDNGGCDVHWNLNEPNPDRGCGYTKTTDGSLHAKWYDFDAKGCPGRAFVFETGQEFEVLTP